MNTKRITLSLFSSAILLCCAVARADLTVKVDEPKQVGQKAVIKLTIKNTFKESVESARAQVFLLDDEGRITGQAARWVIGGTKDKPPLSPDKETTFNFVVDTTKPFTTAKVSFSRVVLQGGKLADADKEVQIQNAVK